MGVPFQRDNPGRGNADWFFWTATKVIDQAYVPGTPEVPAVTCPDPGPTTTTPPAPECVTAVWKMPSWKNSTTPTWPQTLVSSVETECYDLDVPVPSDCGTQYQIDSYLNNATTEALIDGGFLNGPNSPNESFPPNAGWGSTYKLVKNADCLPPAEECVVTYGEWFTEGDDTAPTVEQNGLRFVGGVNDSMGIGIGISGNLQGLPTITYTAEGDAYSMARFYPRIVVNSSADGGPAYNSITVTSEGPVDLTSIASARVKLAEGGARVSKTIAEWIAYYPNNEMLAFFFNTDSSSNAEVSVLLKSVSAGECFSKAWGYGNPPTPEVEYGEWMTGEYECGDTTVVETRVVYSVPFVYSPEAGKWVRGTPVETDTEEQKRDLTPEEIAALECPVPAEPTYVDVCGTKDDSFTVLATEGIRYESDDARVDGVGTVTITAFYEGSESETPIDTWAFEFTDKDCPPGLALTGSDSTLLLVGGATALLAIVLGALAVSRRRNQVIEQ